MHWPVGGMAQEIQTHRIAIGPMHAILAETQFLALWSIRVEFVWWRFVLSMSLLGSLLYLTYVMGTKK
jgi:hypothetical protein